MPDRPLRRLRRLIIPPLRASGLRSVIIPPLRCYFRYFPVHSGKLLVWRLLASHLWWLETRVTAPTRFGASLDVDARDYVGRFVYYFGLWEPALSHFIQRRLQPGDCFIDVGANVGYFSVMASRLVGASGTVVCIEAIPRTFDVLRGNLERNGVRNARPINVAVWDREDVLSFYLSPNTIDGTSTVVPSMAARHGLLERTRVRAAPLSSLLAADEVRRARLIKIDVEGAERKLLPDLLALLRTARHDLEIVIELSAESYSDIVSSFHGHGFRAFRLTNDYSPASYIGEHVGRLPQRMDVLPPNETHVDLVFSRTAADTLD